MARRAVSTNCASTRRVCAAITLVGALVIAACSTDQSADGFDDVEPATESVRLLIVPHPDDELGAIAALAPTDTELGLVSVLLTRGEATVRCDAETRRAPACGDRREAAWHEVIDAIDAHVGMDTGSAGPIRREQGAASEPIEVTERRGTHGLRIVHDLGDGQLDASAVLDALCEAAERATGLGHRIDQIVVAAYDGGDGELSVVYGHRDHRAANEAVLEQDCIEAPRLERVPRSDSPDVILTTDPALYDRLLADDGVAQSAYGWLAFSFAQGGRLDRWEVSDHDDITPFSRDQGFRCWDPTGSESGAQHCP